MADVIRSKNSGPYELTFDVIFKTFDDYNFFKEHKPITAESYQAPSIVSPIVDERVVEREVLDLTGRPDVDAGTLAGEYPLTDLDVVLIDIADR